MIGEYKKADTSKILYIINNASLKYKGIIPDDCWQEPYMSEKELINEFNDGVRMYGYHMDNKLIGVIGFQEVKDVMDESNVSFSGWYENTKGKQGITYSTLVVPLIKAVQELTEKNEKLQNKINDLEIFIMDKLGDD